jgi:hypothetical protein
VTERKDIGLRLEAWARWCMSTRKTGADSMTGAICESLRKAALGNVWSGHDQRDQVDEDDAVRIERAMRVLPVAQRLLLHWCYIEQARPEVVCRKLSIPIRPASEFVERFRAAQDAVEDAADNEGNR